MAESPVQASQLSLEDAFPGEIHSQIAGLLDPVGLISLSQASRYFRKLIKPGKTEFAERLLVWECLEKHGGGTSLFHTHADGYAQLHETLDPWEANLWACPGCLQLLPHHRFDNKSLLWLATRKPAPGTSAANIASSWVPAKSEDHSEKEAKRIVREVKSYYRTDHPDRDDPSRENPRCGYARYKRRCIECQYQLGMYRGRAGPPRSSEITPTSIRLSRRILLGSGFVRFWPKLEDMIQSKPPSLQPGKTPWRREKKVWEMYMIRCLGCEEWKELRAFRIEGARRGWAPSEGQVPQFLPRDITKDDSSPKMVSRSVDDLRCNHCFAREHGEERLTEILATRFDMNIQPLLSELEWHLHSHYKSVKYLAAEGDAERHRPKTKDHEGNFDKLVRLVRQAEENNDVLSQTLNWRLKEADVDRLRTEAKEFKDIYIKMRKSYPRLASKLRNDEHFLKWVNDFENSEQEWKWLKDCQRKITENPALLLEYALNYDAMV
ncbi:unnamed protein product [Clonostachys rosea]|uniref:F-box domain-containing protein n=1 Tax=Bionectria ochroleuca TaxID=29856 RepID=A0ABY6UIB3_BIOOC|nr:unnamed protein product [Clonostachys rosea]